MPTQDGSTPLPHERKDLEPATLPQGHRCRVDDLAYTSVGDWYADHRGRVPIQAAAGLDHYIKQHGSAFAEAFAALSGPGGPLILLERGSPSSPR
jgi:hypothetical protein